MGTVPAAGLVRQGGGAHQTGQYVHEHNVTPCTVLSRLALSYIVQNKTFPPTTPMLMIVSSTGGNWLGQCP